MRALFSAGQGARVFAAAIYHRPRIRLTIRQRTQVLAAGHGGFVVTVGPLKPSVWNAARSSTVADASLQGSERLASRAAPQSTTRSIRSTCGGRREGSKRHVDPDGSNTRDLILNSVPA